MKKPVVEYIEFGKKNPSPVLAIIISIIILTAVITVAYLFLSRPQSSSELQTPQPNQTEIFPLQTKIQECATTTPSQECILFYSTPDIEDKCNQLEKLKNQCLYNFATINERMDTCYTITNETLKNKCQEEIESFFISDE